MGGGQNEFDKEQEYLKMMDNFNVINVVTEEALPVDWVPTPANMEPIPM